MPIYTVDDNFLSTYVYAALLPKIDTQVFKEMGHPLRIINSFIIQNLSQSNKKDISSMEPDY